MLQNVIVYLLFVASHSLVSIPAGTGTVSRSSSFDIRSNNCPLYLSNKYAFPFSLFSSVTGFLVLAPRRFLLQKTETDMLTVELKGTQRFLLIRNSSKIWPATFQLTATIQATKTLSTFRALVVS